MGNMSIQVYYVISALLYDDVAEHFPNTVVNEWITSRTRHWWSRRTERKGGRRIFCPEYFRTLREWACHELRAAPSTEPLQFCPDYFRTLPSTQSSLGGDQGLWIERISDSMVPIPWKKWWKWVRNWNHYFAIRIDSLLCNSRCVNTSSAKIYRDEKEEPLRDALLKTRDGNCLFN